MQNAAAVAALGSNINYHFIGAAAPAIGPGMAAPPHFGSIFKPTIIGNDENMNPVRQGQLPLWMAAAPGQTTTSSQGQEFQSFVGSENPMVTTPLSSSGSFQLNWNSLVGNNKISTTSNSNSTNNNNGEEMDGNHHQSQVMSVPIPSLFSTQHRPHHHHHQSPSANMSATALLQKAAQIGATTSDPAFLGSLGLQVNNNNNNNNNNSNSNNQVVVVQDNNNGNDNKFSGLYSATSISMVSSHLGSEMESHAQMYPSKRRHIQQNEGGGGGGGGQTRDFLGVGVQSICHPSSINGWI
nr:zinc finger protein NUTCRACKER-like isoform X2 [Ipomoea trifida]